MQGLRKGEWSAITQVHPVRYLLQNGVNTVRYLLSNGVKVFNPEMGDEERNREYKVCLNKRAILRLFDRK